MVFKHERKLERRNRLVQELNNLREQNFKLLS